MSSKYSNKYPIPEKFPEILHDFSREVLRYMPKDILDFAVQYFYSLEISTPLNFIEGASKDIPKAVEEKVPSEKKEQLKDKRQDMSTPSITTNQNTQNLFFNKGEQSEKKNEEKEEKEDIKEIRETHSSKMNSPLQSEESRPQSERSNGSGVVRASKVFVNNVFQNTLQNVKENLMLYGKTNEKNTGSENIFNESGHTFNDISGNSEDKNAVRLFVGDLFQESKKQDV